MLKDGARVLIAHWPGLLLVFFAGKAVSGGLLWLAIEISSVSPVGGMLALPGASIAMLIALVLMLRSVIPSLPELQASLTGDTTGERLRHDLTLAVQILIPFLAVYASHGMLREDLLTYVHSGTADEWLNQGFAADFSRVTFGTETQVAAIVIIALVLRKVIAGFDLGGRHVGIAGFAGYLEALWLVTLASYFASSLGELREWAMSRVVTQWVIESFAKVIDVLGPVGETFNAVAGVVAALFFSMGVLVIVPVAWIAVGATIYGASLPAAKPLLTSEEVNERIKQIPNPVRRVVAEVTSPVVNPVTNTVKAIGRIAVAGLVPMVLLCILFAGTSQLRVLTVGVLRTLIGPHEEGFWVAALPYMDLFAQAVYITVMVALLAASVNAIILGQREARLRAEEKGRLDAPEQAGHSPVA